MTNSFTQESATSFYTAQLINAATTTYCTYGSLIIFSAAVSSLNIPVLCIQGPILCKNLIKLYNIYNETSEIFYGTDDKIHSNDVQSNSLKLNTSVDSLTEFPKIPDDIEDGFETIDCDSKELSAMPNVNSEQSSFINTIKSMASTTYDVTCKYHEPIMTAANTISKVSSILQSSSIEELSKEIGNALFA